MSVTQLRTYTVAHPRATCSVCGSKTGPQHAQVNVYDGSVYTWRTCPCCEVVIRWVEQRLTDYLDPDEGVTADMAMAELSQYALELEAAALNYWHGWTPDRVSTSLAALTYHENGETK